jgi:hypothetical protein
VIQNYSNSSADVTKQTIFSADQLNRKAGFRLHQQRDVASIWELVSSNAELLNQKNK